MFWEKHYHFKQTTKAKELENKEGIQNLEIMIMKIQPSWLTLFPKFVFFVELEDMSSQNVHK
jgi:hypothetical protein